MTLKGTAMRLGISVKEVQDLIEKGEIKAVQTRFGGWRQTTVLSDSVEAYKRNRPSSSWPNLSHKKGDQKRAQILDAYRRWQREYGRPPSIRELMTLTGLSSTSSVWAHLRILEKKCLLKNLGGCRGYVLNAGVAGWACVGRWVCGTTE